MKLVIRITLLSTLGLVGLLGVIRCASTPKTSGWLSKSNEIANQFSYDTAKLFPESGSRIGLREFDKQGMIPTVELVEKERQLLQQWKSKVSENLAAATDTNLQIDLEILNEDIDLALANLDLEEKEKHIPVFKVSDIVYRNLRTLINEQSNAKRKSDAVDRFKVYAGLKQTGFVDAAKEFTLTLQKKYEGQTTAFSYPSKEEINKYLENSPSFVQGTEEVLKNSGRSDWKNDFEKYKAQVEAYDAFVKESILPLCSNKTQISAEAYLLALRGYGNKTSPEEMIKTGRNQFQMLYLELRSLAKDIAKKHKLAQSNPAYISLFLKKQLVSKPDEVKALYESANEKLQSIITANELVTLPSKPLVIRIADEAESKAAPVPHLNTPPLLNNKGETPEFVAPSAANGEVLYDDFNHPGFALALTAHEGRPGHDLQFSNILARPISIIRAQYAFNSVNVEGWALYAEHIIFPYLSIEEKFSFLQSKMWRAARYFLDPMVQLGQANERFVIQILHKQLGLSNALAKVEYERYAFRMPGQAPSYFQGFQNLINLKENLEEQLGKMETKCFHDTLLSFGLMPHDKIEKLKNSFVDCKQI